MTIGDEEKKKLVGELYIFWDSPNKDEANGESRAYLCALRVAEDYRGLGLSSMMISEAKKIAKSNGFTELTIGVDNDNYQRLSEIYKKWGFNTLVKKSFIDYHYMDKDNKPTVFDESSDIRLCKI